MSAKITLEITRGALFQVTVRAVALGDVSGWGAHMQVREAPGAQVLADLSTTTGEIADNGAASSWTVTMLAAVTAGLPSSRTPLVWDLFVWPPGSPPNEPLRLAAGFAQVSDPVTVPVVV